MKFFVTILKLLEEIIKLHLSLLIYIQTPFGLISPIGLITGSKVIQYIILNIFFRRILLSFIEFLSPIQRLYRNL